MCHHYPAGMANLPSDNYPASCPNSVPQLAASLPPLSQTSWASQTIPITLRLFKQTAAQFPSPDPQLRDSLWAPPPSPPSAPPHTSTASHFQRRVAPAETMAGELTVGSFPCLNVCRHLVKCLRPTFQRTTPPHHRACLSRQSQIRRGLLSLQKPRMHYGGWSQWCARFQQIPWQKQSYCPLSSHPSLKTRSTL